jgi:hypothetical protein
MPPRTPTKAKAPKAKTAKVKATATKARVIKTKIEQSGKNTRVKGHLKATARRQQAKRDTRNG